LSPLVCTHAHSYALTLHTVYTCICPHAEWSSFCLAPMLYMLQTAKEQPCPGALHVLVPCMSWCPACLGALHVLVPCMSWCPACPGALHVLVPCTWPTPSLALAGMGLLVQAPALHLPFKEEVMLCIRVHSACVCAWEECDGENGCVCVCVCWCGGLWGRAYLNSERGLVVLVEQVPYIHGAIHLDGEKHARACGRPRACTATQTRACVGMRRALLSDNRPCRLMSLKPQAALVGRGPQVAMKHWWP